MLLVTEMDDGDNIKTNKKLTWPVPCQYLCQRWVVILQKRRRTLCSQIFQAKQFWCVLHGLGLHPTNLTFPLKLLQKSILHCYPPPSDRQGWTIQVIAS